MVPLLGVCGANGDNLEAFVDCISDDFATVLSCCAVRATEHQVEEVGALVDEEVLIDPVVNDRRFFCLTHKVYP